MSFSLSKGLPSSFLTFHSFLYSSCTASLLTIPTSPFFHWPAGLHPPLLWGISNRRFAVLACLASLSLQLYRPGAVSLWLVPQPFFPLTVWALSVWFLERCRHAGLLQLQGTAPVVRFTLRLISNTARASLPPPAARSGSGSSAGSRDLSYCAPLSLCALISHFLYTGCLLLSGQPLACQQALLLLSSTITNAALQTPGHSQTHSTCSP